MKQPAVDALRQLGDLDRKQSDAKCDQGVDAIKQNGVRVGEKGEAQGQHHKTDNTVEAETKCFLFAPGV